MATTEKTDWEKLTEAQLKGALVRRGLDSSGRKAELVKRLQEHESGSDIKEKMADTENFKEMTLMQLKAAAKSRGIDNTGKKDDIIKRLQEYEEKKLLSNGKTGEDEEDAKQEQTMEDDTAEAQVDSHLAQSTLRWGYESQNALRTVLLYPFKVAVMRNKNFLSWMEEANAMTVKKSPHGTDAIMLNYSTVAKGDAAYVDLKNEMKKLDVTVIHPAFHKSGTETYDIDESEFDLLVKDKPQGVFSARTLVFENLPPELNTDEKLLSLFPEVYKVFNFEYAVCGTGIALLEFFTDDEADEFYKTSGKELDIEGTEVKVYRLAAREPHWTQLHSQFDRIKSVEHNELIKKGVLTEEKEPLTDEERIEFNKGIRAVQESMDNIHHNEEYFGVEKLQKFTQIAKDLRQRTRRLVADTKRRKKEGLDIPEEESDMIELTKKFVVKDYVTERNRPETLNKKEKEFKRKLDMAKDHVERLTTIMNFTKYANRHPSTIPSRKPKMLEKRYGGGKNDNEARSSQWNTDRDRRDNRDRFQRRDQDRGNRFGGDAQKRSYNEFQSQSRGSRFGRETQRRPLSYDDFHRQSGGEPPVKRFTPMGGAMSGMRGGMGAGGGMSSMGGGMGAGGSMSGMGGGMRGGGNMSGMGGVGGNTDVVNQTKQILDNLSNVVQQLSSKGQGSGFSGGAGMSGGGFGMSSGGGNMSTGSFGGPMGARNFFGSNN